MKLAWIALAVAAFPESASAEIATSGADKFELTNTVVIPQKPEVVWRALIALPQWWDPAHTYSGKARNLSLSAKAGGCFCEIIPEDGSQIEHGRVVYLRPNKALRLYAALGPLQSLAVMGNLSWTLKAVEGGTELRQSYLVFGNVDGGLGALSSPVNSVMTLQFDRLTAYASQAK